MLSVSEETVRRWIRDGKLNAKRGLGRNGNEISLEDVVEFANRPPSLYLDALSAWLKSHDIAFSESLYTTCEEPPNQLAKVAGLGAGVGALLAPISPIAAVASAIGGAAACVASQPKTETHRQLCLCTDLEVEIPKNADETVSEDGGWKPDAVDPQKPAESTISVNPADPPNRDDTRNIQEKIVQEKLKLIKLKQELAQLTAQISICESQIEYYQVLLKQS